MPPDRKIDHDEVFIDRVFVVEISTHENEEIGESELRQAIYRGVEGIVSEDAVLVKRQPAS